MSVRAFFWSKDRLQVLDQRLLPHKVHYITCRTPEDVAVCIKDMAVRGAPAIGCVAAYGLVLAQQNSKSKALNPKGINHLGFSASNLELVKAARLLKAARPTAVNLAWAVDRMLARGVSLAEAKKIEKEDLLINQSIGKNGSRLINKDSVILTHCNTGALATAGYGTALGVIRAAHGGRKVKKVLVDETRPYLQGARLTAWELKQEKIPHELITDNMAGHMMKSEKVSAVIVGCDRVAANGDTANKIGTYSLAVLARHHNIPFYVAMPLSTLDLNKKSGKDIPIEERSSSEVVNMGGKMIAPEGTKARHPAFDVTPGELITGIITEHGVIRPPYLKNLQTLIKKRMSKP